MRFGAFFLYKTTLLVKSPKSRNNYSISESPNLGIIYLIILFFQEHLLIEQAPAYSDFSQYQLRN